MINMTPQTGDLVVDSTSAILANDTQMITITNDVVTSGADFDEVQLAGADLASRIAGIAAHPGVGDSNVDTVHIADSSVATDKFSLVSVAKGGTGLSHVGNDEFVFVTATGLTSSPDLTSKPDGIEAAGDWALRLDDGTAYARFYLDGGSLKVEHDDGTGPVTTNLSEASAGSAPSIVSLALSDSNLSYTLRDADGDLRSLHLAWYATAQSPPPDSTDVFHHASGEGASTYAAPLGAVELDLVNAINTGSTTYSDVYTNTALSGVTVYAVAEDGPGNLSVVTRAP